MSVIRIVEISGGWVGDANKGGWRADGSAEGCSSSGTRASSECHSS